MVLTDLQKTRLLYVLNSGKSFKSCCDTWGITAQAFDNMLQDIENKYPGFRYNFKFILKGQKVQGNIPCVRLGWNSL